MATFVQFIKSLASASAESAFVVRHWACQRLQLAWASLICYEIATSPKWHLSLALSRAVAVDAKKLRHSMDRSLIESAVRE